VSEGLRRIDLQKAAEGKLRDAHLLVQNARFSSAYYLAGYTAEMGLKACIARRMVQEVIPDKVFIQRTYTHALKDLVGLAGLNAELEAEKANDVEFGAYWGIAGQWTPNSRYASIDSMSAQLMVQAIGDQKSGVLQWIKKYW